MRLFEVVGVFTLSVVSTGGREPSFGYSPPAVICSFLHSFNPPRPVGERARAAGFRERARERARSPVWLCWFVVRTNRFLPVFRIVKVLRAQLRTLPAWLPTES